MQQGSQAKSVANVAALRTLETAFREAYPREQDGLADLKTTPRTYNWATTLGLVDKAAEALNVAEQRIRGLEARHEELVQLTRDELQSAQARVKAAEERAIKAEHWANEAEKGAKDADEWLTRLHERLQRLPIFDRAMNQHEDTHASVAKRLDR